MHPNDIVPHALQAHCRSSVQKFENTAGTTEYNRYLQERHLNAVLTLNLNVANVFFLNLKKNINIVEKNHLTSAFSNHMDRLYYSTATAPPPPSRGLFNT